MDGGRQVMNDGRPTMDSSLSPVLCSPSSQLLDSRAYRKAMGLFATGVTVVASGIGENLRAMTANAVTSLSLEPALLIFCLSKKANMATQLQKEQGFSVNILGQKQQDLSIYFAGGWKDETRPDFEFIPWQGGPLLQGCAAAIGCVLYQMLEGGDHWIVIGKVVALHEGIVPANPLIFYRGHYHSLATEPEYEIPAIWYFDW
jgi:flavin reductase (DIM6/NTAB) family NADH-FMN oxidoreductase RutF